MYLNELFSKTVLVLFALEIGSSASLLRAVSSTDQNAYLKPSSPEIDDYVVAGKSSIQLIEKLEKDNVAVRGIEEEIADLILLVEHIDTITPDLVALGTDSRKTEEVIRRWRTLSDKLKASDSIDTKDAAIQFRDVFFEPEDWLSFRTLNFKTTKVRDSHLKPVDPQVGKEMRKFLDNISKEESREKNPAEDLPIDFDDIKVRTLFDENINKVKESILELRKSIEDKITSLNKVAEPIRLRHARILQEISRAVNGQTETFTLVQNMIYMLAFLYCFSMVARIGVVWFTKKFDSVSVFDERTMIEFGGMAFILLAIIILGNTEKLDKQVLGSLIGTVAGYIFGRGVLSSGVRQDSSSQGQTKELVHSSSPKEKE